MTFLNINTLRQISAPLCVLPGSGNSRSQPLGDRKPASAAREDLPASRRRCDSFSHLWPEVKAQFYLNALKYRKSITHEVSSCVGVCMCHLEDNTGLFQQILRGYGTTDHTTGERKRKNTKKTTAGSDLILTEEEME